MSGINNYTAMRFICRSCLSQRSKVASPRRTFATSPHKSKAVPSFTPSSSPELDALFTEFREKLFIPASLSTTHQRLVYRPTRHHVLTNDPGVTVPIGEDEEIRIMPMDYSERPNKQRNYHRIKQILANTQDDDAWQNLLPFFHGLQAFATDSPRILREQIVRIGLNQNKTDLIIRLISDPKNTGFSMSRPGIVNAFMYTLHRKAQQVAFKGPEMDDITRHVQHVCRLMEKTEHCGNLSHSQGFDSRRSLITLGMLLETAAANCINNHRANDEDGQVADYLAKALTLSEVGISDGTSPNIWRCPRSDEEHRLQRVERSALEVLLTAFKLAAQISGLPAIHQRAALDSRLSAITTRLEYLDQRGLQSYQERQRRKAETPQK